MNATSAHPAKGSDSPAIGAVDMQPILVWDAPVRVFHWLMVLCFVGAYLTSDSEAWRLVHVTLGYTMAGLVVFRLVWGLLGTRYARFASFVRGPRSVARYLRTLLRHDPEHHTGHNPAGALAIVGILGLTIAIAASGWATYNDVTGEWAADLHEVVGNAMLLLIGIHIAGVAVSSWLHNENLPRTMVTGRKVGAPQHGIRSAWWTVAAAMLAVVLGFWYWQWHTAPVASGPGNAQAASPAHSAKRAHHDD